jgi:peptidoglycan/xylan/chitin deacetylase (PgdA/CDA1 family)
MYNANSYAPSWVNAQSLVSRTQPSIALTFDDGPDESSTSQVLDVLAEFQVHATFFLIGAKVQKYPQVVRRMLGEGHAIGSHSMNHPDPETTSAISIARDYRAGRRALEQVVGQSMPLFRPPRGIIDLHHVLIIRALGLKTWLWNKDPGDWTPEASVQSILDGVGEPTSGDIVLLHDGIQDTIDSPSDQNRSATISALPDLIDRVRSSGFAFTTL